MGKAEERAKSVSKGIREGAARGDAQRRETPPKRGGETGPDGAGKRKGEGRKAGPGRKKGKENQGLGRRGERAAARYLELSGYEILELNWTCSFGEADIIAREGDTLVFAEVKTRRSIAKGFPSEAVGPKKRARYERIAACYLAEYDRLDVPVRFDIIALLVVGPDRAMLRHYVSAFQVLRP